MSSMAPDSPPPSTRDHRRHKDRSRPNNQQTLTRPIQISKSLSRLLRHAAVQEKIPVDNHGYIRLDHVLNWNRMKSFSPRVTVQEIMEVVEGNDKGRFGLRIVPEVNREGSGVGQDENPGRRTAVGVSRDGEKIEEHKEEETETQRALAAFSSGTIDPKSFLIRATQGHSMTLIEPDNLLVPITLSDLEDNLTHNNDTDSNLNETNIPSSTSTRKIKIPNLAVHGTFRGSWETILRDGALKKMRRNHVHFASGPPLHEVLETTNEKKVTGTNLADLMEKSKVVSGMRKDAQVLIYVDLQRCLTSTSSSSSQSQKDAAPSAVVPNQNSKGDEEDGLKWYVSENQVLLCPGLGEEGRIPMEYWHTVVEIKDGVGVLWSADQGGVVQDLPDRLKGRGVPMGKGRGSGGRGRGRGRGKG